MTAVIALRRDRFRRDALGELQHSPSSLEHPPSALLQEARWFRAYAREKLLGARQQAGH
jgi:hypothetical protein